MALIPIDPHAFTLAPHRVFDEQMVLLTCGNFSARHFNQMTIGWGSVGTMWNKPFVQIAVRPTRYTYQFLEQYDDFTLTAFPPEYVNALRYLGSHSGRDGDKLAMTDLRAAASSAVASPTYEQAELSIECRKMYFHDLDPRHFLDSDILRQYPLPDYHRIYFGEIVAIWGVEKYRG